MVAIRSPTCKSESPGPRQRISPDYTMREDEDPFFGTTLFHFLASVSHQYY